MIVDPLVKIYKSTGQLPASYIVPNGQTSLPRYRQDVAGFAYQDEDGADYRLNPYLDYYSAPETIVDAASIPFLLPAAISDPRSQVRSLSCAVVNTTAQHGYSPGEMVIPVRGAAIELQATQILVNVASNGVRIVRKSGTRGEAACNVARWQLIVFGIFYIPLIN